MTEKEIEFNWLCPACEAVFRTKQKCLDHMAEVHAFGPLPPLFARYRDRFEALAKPKVFEVYDNPDSLIEDRVTSEFFAPLVDLGLARITKFPLRKSFGLHRKVIELTWEGRQVAAGVA